MIFIAASIALLFFVLACIHFYWALFGLKNPALVLPKKTSEEKAKLPSAPLTALVGFGLLLFALVFLNEVVRLVDLSWLTHIQMGIGILFLIRAIGDFKYVGFFKTVKDSQFSRSDTLYYSPLCLLLALLIGCLIVLG